MQIILPFDSLIILPFDISINKDKRCRRMSRRLVNLRSGERKARLQIQLKVDLKGRKYNWISIWGPNWKNPETIQKQSGNTPDMNWKYVLSCLVLPCLALPCIALPCLALPWLAFSRVAFPFPSLFCPFFALLFLALPCLFFSLFFLSWPFLCFYCVLVAR